MFYLGLDVTSKSSFVYAWDIGVRYHYSSCSV
jgi:hypothetical protein